jgi:cytochrome c oxidase cbb3-type subunit 4
MDMDINTLRSAMTVLAFISFSGIVWWAYRPHSLPGFAVAEQLPFADERSAPPAPDQGQQK